jgi:hypothetical protein
MKIIVNAMRRILAHFNYDVRRVTGPMLRLETLFREVTQLFSSEIKVHVFDDDPQTLQEILRSFQQEQLTLHRHSLQRDFSSVVKVPPKEFILLVDLEGVQLAELAEQNLSLESAVMVIASATLGSFNSGVTKFSSIRESFLAIGLELIDVATSTQPVVVNSSQSRVFLVFSSLKNASRLTKDKANSRRRVNEVKAFLPKTIACRSNFRWLTGKGSFGHNAGVFNPGAIEEKSGFLLLMRGEFDSWNSQKQSELKYFSSWRVELAEFDSTLSRISNKTLNFTGALSKGGCRLEDFRLFRVGQQIYSNHSVITLPAERSALDQPLQRDAQIVRVGVSEYSDREREMKFVGFPTIDFQTSTIEKNWAMFTVGVEVFVIYSICPYRVFRASNWPELKFIAAVDCQLDLTVVGASGMIRNSVNPVEYDERHLIHIVHAVHFSKQYIFWALLIDKVTLIPRFISNVPVARAGISVAGSIVYVCSVVSRGKDVLLFAGINDCSAGFWEIERSVLDSTWFPLPA